MGEHILKKEKKKEKKSNIAILAINFQIADHRLVPEPCDGSVQYGSESICT